VLNFRKAKLRLVELSALVAWSGCFLSGATGSAKRCCADHIVSVMRDVANCNCRLKMTELKGISDFDVMLEKRRMESEVMRKEKIRVQASKRTGLNCKAIEIQGWQS
jgi:hypothetical protein